MERDEAKREPKNEVSSERQEYEQAVRALAALQHRGSATEREHQAADHLAQQLQRLGLCPTRESFAGSRSSGARLLLHVLVAAAGVGLAGYFPLAAVGLGAAALLSVVAEQTTRGVWLSWFLVRHRSFNVVARVPPVRGPVTRRVLVCAHYDTQRAGLIWSEMSMRVQRLLLGRLPPFLRTPFLPVLTGMAMQLIWGVGILLFPASLAMRLAGAAILLVYGIAGIFLAEWACGRFVPGASDNASGVAAVLTLAKRWLADPTEGTELVVLMSGCEESGLLGAAAWCGGHREEMRELPMRFLNLDGLGCGPPRFLGRDVPVAGLPRAYPTELVRMASALAAEEGLADAGPHIVFGPTDGLAFLVRGVDGLTVVGFRDGGILPHYHRDTDTADNMNFRAAWTGVEFAWSLLRRL